MKKSKTLLFMLLCVFLMFSFTSCGCKHDWYYSSIKTISSEHPVYACYNCEETSLGTPLSKDNNYEYPDFEETDEYSEDNSEDDSDYDSANTVTVYVTDSGEKYHSSGCQYLSSSKQSISLEDAINDGYTPCSRCNPPTE